MRQHLAGLAAFLAIVGIVAVVPLTDVLTAPAAADVQQVQHCSYDPFAGQQCWWEDVPHTHPTTANSPPSLPPTLPCGITGPRSDDCNEIEDQLITGTTAAPTSSAAAPTSSTAAPTSSTAAPPPTDPPGCGTGLHDHPGGHGCQGSHPPPACTATGYWTPNHAGHSQQWVGTCSSTLTDPETSHRHGGSGHPDYQTHTRPDCQATSTTWAPLGHDSVEIPGCPEKFPENLHRHTSTADGAHTDYQAHARLGCEAVITSWVPHTHDPVEILACGDTHKICPDPNSYTGTVAVPVLSACPDLGENPNAAAMAAATTMANYYLGQIPSDPGQFDWARLGELLAEEGVLFADELETMLLAAAGADGLTEGLVSTPDTDRGRRTHEFAKNAGAFVNFFVPLDIEAASTLIEAGQTAFSTTGGIANKICAVAGGLAARQSTRSWVKKVAKWKLTVLAGAGALTSAMACDAVEIYVEDQANNRRSTAETSGDSQDNVAFLVPISLSAGDDDAATTTPATPTTSTTAPALSSSEVVGVCVRADSATGGMEAEWSFTATSTAPEPAEWAISLTFSASTSVTLTRPGTDRSLSATLQTILFTIFAGRPWSLYVDGGTDTSGVPIEAEQTFPTNGIWTGTAGVGQC